MGDIRRVAISTGGGDAPGLNAVIRAATLAALRRGWEVLGVRDGFDGVWFPERYPGGEGVVALTRSDVSGIAHLGGTVLGTTNRNSPMRFPMTQPDGTIAEVDRTAELVSLLHEMGVDALITVGGDGSLTIGEALAQRGLTVVGVPKTIDNDLDKTAATFGFNTAVDFATECIDRLFTTATSHGRIMVVEVMGRYAGWIALHAGLAAGAHAILIPEIPYDLAKVVGVIEDRAARGHRFTIVVVAEGAKALGGSTSVLGQAVGQAEKLGGVGDKVARELQALTGRESRTVVLGHLVRGGSPTAYDRLLGMRFGAAAVRALEEGQRSVMVALQGTDIGLVPIADAISQLKLVHLDSDTLLTARDIGICFGD